MVTYLLSSAAYRQTIGGSMRNITGKQALAVDIWPYVKALVDEGRVLPQVYEDELVEEMYANSTNTFYHVMLPGIHAGVFMVIVVNVAQQRITGHYPLNLAE